MVAMWMRMVYIGGVVGGSIAVNTDDALDLMNELAKQGVWASIETADDEIGTDSADGRAIKSVCAPAAHKDRLRVPLPRVYACPIKWLTLAESREHEAKEMAKIARALADSFAADADADADVDADGDDYS